jgi:hypothetical protein
MENIHSLLCDVRVRVLNTGLQVVNFVKLVVDVKNIIGCVSEKTYCFYITKSSLLMLCRELIII